jgi:hypothetical protein
MERLYSAVLDILITVFKRRPPAVKPLARLKAGLRHGRRCQATSGQPIA